MNSNGGSLLIGVADDQLIMGLKKDYQTLKKPDQDGFEQAIITSISTNFGAHLCRNIHILFHSINNEDICRLIVTKSKKPVYLKHEGKLKLFVRTGGGTRELDIQESVEYIATHWAK
jgi:predicted HTH transcriptional regulator